MASIIKQFTHVKVAKRCSHCQNAPSFTRAKQCPVCQGAGFIETYVKFEDFYEALKKIDEERS